MIEKPLFSINKFTGSGDGGMFFNEGFIPYVENGSSVLREGITTNKIFDNSDTGFKTLTAVTNVQAISYVLALNGSNVYRLVMDSSGQFFVKNFIGSAFTPGYIGKTPTTGNYTYSLKPDLYQMASGNILYTNNYAAGVIIRGKVKTGSSTTTIIDSAGRNFTTLGVTTANTVTNLVTGAVYAITAIGNGDATNDKLTFTASGALANTANDEFAIIVHQKYDLTTGITLPSFVGQPDAINWSRQIKQFQDEYFILNGGWLAKISSDESTVSNNFKQLPLGFNATCFDTNTDRILVAARSISHGFRLLLWNGYSDGWNNILEVEDEINCLKNYLNGWIFVINGVLYFTDGYQIQKLQSYNNLSVNNYTSIQPRNFNGIEIINESIVTYSAVSDYSRGLPGVYIWNKKFGWSYSPVVFKGRLYGSPTGIFLSNYATANSSYVSPGIDIGLAGGLDYLLDNTAYTSGYLTRSAIFFSKLPNKMQIKRIGINLGTNNNIIGDSYSQNQTKISVNIGSGKGNMFRSIRAISVTDSTHVSVDGTVRSGSVGDEIQIMEQSPCPITGERSFISSIAQKGENTEVWTLSPALSAGYNSNTDIKLTRVKSTVPLSKTISVDDFDKPIMFDTASEFVSDKLYLEVVVSGVATSCPISINSIDIYG